MKIGLTSVYVDDQEKALALLKDTCGNLIQLSQLVRGR
jgi:hypothetical protein